VDGEEFAGGEGEVATFVVGGGQVLPEFDAALHGSAAGETRQATVHFPEQYPSKELAGKDALFDITF